MREILLNFLVWVLYPLWLAAGGADYLCHRRTNIESTSGAKEAWLHVGQFAAIAVALLLAVCFDITILVWISMLAAVVLHSVLSYIDVRYTQQRRHISPFEQHVHGFLDVIPLIAVCLIGILNWPPTAAAPAEGVGEPTFAGLMLLGSFVVLTGGPVIEELTRTLRASRY